MSLHGYPPSHRDTNRPQPEICPLCGTIAPGDTFMQADVEGLRGWYICGITEGCKQFRVAMSWKDRRRVNPREHSYIGNSRVYEVNGMSKWGEDAALQDHYLTVDAHTNLLFTDEEDFIKAVGSEQK